MTQRQEVIFLLRGTYDPKTGSYISPEGVGMCIAPEFVPKGTKIIGAPPSPLLSKILEPPPLPPELKKAIEKGVEQLKVEKGLNNLK